MTADFGAPRQLDQRAVWLTVGGLMLGMFVMGLDTLLIVTALPTIVGDLGGFDRASWLLSSFMITSTASAPMWGKLGDLWGRKRLYQAAIVVFAFTSVLCALAQNIDQLIAARALRGVAAGGLMVLPVAIVGDVVPGRAAAKYLGVINANVAVATLLGPLVGGFFVDQASWRWAFIVGVPPAIVALFASHRLQLQSKPITLEGVDFLGAALSMAAAVSVLLIVTLGGRQIDWLSAETASLVVISVVLLGVLIAVERRVADPTVPLDVFRIRGFALLMAGTFVSGVAMFGAWSLIPVFLQLVTGASATVSGLLLLPFIVGISVSSFVCGTIMSRTGRWKPLIVIGQVMAAAGFALYTQLGSDSGRLEVVLMTTVTGLGLGAVIQPIFVIAQSMVGPHQLGVGTSTTTFFRQLGQAFGGAIAITVFTSRVDGHLGRQLGVEAADALGDDVRRGTPTAVAALDDRTRQLVQRAFAAALHDGFITIVPIAVTAVLVFTIVPNVRLHEARVDHDLDDDLLAPAEVAGVTTREPPPLDRATREAR